jgi:hypothetical protein
MSAVQLLTLSLAVMLVLMTLSARSTDAVQCYVCNSAETHACADPFSNSTAGSLSKCQGRTCTKGKATVNSQTVVVRACADETVADQCQDVTVAGVTSRVCVCNHDLCNAAVGLYATELWAAGAVAVALYGARR